MNTTQLLLLALNCINENKEPTHLEQSHIYVFYCTQIVDMKLTINDFMTQLQINNLVRDTEKETAILSFVIENLTKAEKKFNDRIIALS